MDFAMLAVIMLASLAGPLLAYPRGWHVPVVVGELAMGILLGRTGLGYLNDSDPTFSFLAAIGFGLVMFIAGTHVPVRDHGSSGVWVGARPGLRWWEQGPPFSGSFSPQPSGRATPRCMPC